ncbi:hypothetical protein COLO4_32176 [Corchorus olitorius]|uniref:Uncharacterized protein n=1 Tax=Corchorus olitorius TaxID=93759 RepID=A0A1R3H0M8_9ROSI|nr:hypothetical protein COLO4_32176 [Corchorus olitorius]
MVSWHQKIRGMNMSSCNFLSHCACCLMTILTLLLLPFDPVNLLLLTLDLVNSLSWFCNPPPHTPILHHNNQYTCLLSWRFTCG